MTTSYFPQDTTWPEDDYYPAPYDYAWEQADKPQPSPQIVLLLAVVLVVLFLVVGLGKLVNGNLETAVAPAPATIPQRQNEQPPSQPLPLPTNPGTFVAIYDDYILTQGAHGFSYGHAAIDIAAGNGEPIKSPIQGIVSERFVDLIGNPTLVIENDIYKVTMLHGDYTVGVGDMLAAGDIVGSESNKGNTRDMRGVSCRNRDCGYHTHLNVYNKQQGQNVDPLELMHK